MLPVSLKYPPSTWAPGLECGDWPDAVPISAGTALVLYLSTGGLDLAAYVFTENEGADAVATVGVHLMTHSQSYL